jgi:hypothetical protein
MKNKYEILPVMKTLDYVIMDYSSFINSNVVRRQLEAVKAMRLTEKQVIQLEEEEKLAQMLESGDLTLGEYEKKLDEIEVMPFEDLIGNYDIESYFKSNPDLVVFSRDKGDKWWIALNNPSWSDDRDYYLCHKNNGKECLHWLNDGNVEFKGSIPSSSWGYYPKFTTYEWSPFASFMRKNVKFRIKKEPNYKAVCDIYSISKDVDYYRLDGDRYQLIDNDRDIAEYFSNYMLYQRVES